MEVCLRSVCWNSGHFLRRSACLDDGWISVGFTPISCTVYQWVPAFAHVRVSGRKTERERVSVCVCVCVHARVCLRTVAIIPAKASFPRLCAPAYTVARNFFLWLSLKSSFECVVCHHQMRFFKNFFAHPSPLLLKKCKLQLNVLISLLLLLILREMSRCGLKEFIQFSNLPLLLKRHTLYTGVN